MSALSDALNEANVNQWSAREIARRGGDRVHFATIATYLRGKHGRPGEEILQVFSEVLNIPMPRLRELAELPAGDEEPYEPPREANRLDKRQRKLVDELIRMLAETKAGDGVDRDTAPTTMTPDLVFADPETGDQLAAVEVKTSSAMSPVPVNQDRAGLTLVHTDGIITAVGQEFRRLGQEVPEKIVRVAVRTALDAEKHPELYEDVAARGTTE